MAKKARYVVGFTQSNQVVYGKDEYDEKFGCKVASYTDPLTLLQAKRQLKKLTGKHKTIYELKSVKGV